MPEHTTTVWTCSRCGVVEEVEGTGQPKNWIRVGFVTPPRSGDQATVLGDLCNDELCGGLVVAFVHGEEQTEQERIVELRRMLEGVCEGTS